MELTSNPQMMMIMMKLLPRYFKILSTLNEIPRLAMLAGVTAFTLINHHLSQMESHAPIEVSFKLAIVMMEFTS